MPSTASPTSRPMRCFISRAALLVKVTARICEGKARPSDRMWAMRVVSTRVLPVPAPASTSTGALGGLDGQPLLGVQPFEIARRAVVAVARGHGARGDAAALAGARGCLARFVEEGHVVGKAGHRTECSDSGRKGQKCLRFVLVGATPGVCSRRPAIDMVCQAVLSRPTRCQGRRRPEVSGSGGHCPRGRAGGHHAD